MIFKKKIKVRYINNDAELEYVGGGKSDWVDLHAAKDTALKEGEFYYIPLGVAIELPKNYEALVVPRSSTFYNFGIIQTNSVGVIDEKYCGDDDEWHMPVLATRNCEIPKGTRLCQFRIIKHQPKLIFKRVKSLKNKNRGGLGSTGKV